MNIRLNNIGIVEDSSIRLDGLTIIAGKNNSGKTTVGKALYSLLDAVTNLKEKVLLDRKNYISRQLEKVDSELEFVLLYLRPYFRDNERHGTNSDLYRLFSNLNTRKDESIELYAHRIYEELKSFDCTELKITKEIERYVRVYLHIESKSPEEFIPFLQKRIKNAITILETTFFVLEQDPELIQYVRTSVEQTLLAEFNGQIQPVRNPGAKSRILLTNDNDMCFSLGIENNRIVNRDERIFFASPCKKVFFIDDPFAIDDSRSNDDRNTRGIDFVDVDSVFNKARITKHGIKLKKVLHNNEKPTILEMTILEDTLRPVKEKIESILPGQFEFSQEGTYYIQDGVKLQASNLATGSKMLSIMKVLLDKGELDDSTVLILDEPEAHLHPMWQNAFAEIIVLLVKEIGVHILLTTHSPNFMLAIDAYMRKHELANKTNFYQTVTTENGYVDYQCVNDNLELIYGDFLEYLSEVKALRDLYLFDTGDEE